MSYRPATFFAALFGSITLSSLAFAQSTLQGDVKGVDGRVAKDAEVRVERQDKKAGPVIVKTNAAGRFVVNNLPAGNYTVMAKVAGGVTSPVQVVKLTATHPMMVSFDLRGPVTRNAAGAAKKKKKYVWVPEETGSHLGGRYVEVPDDASADTSADSGANTTKLNEQGLRRLQSPNGMRSGGGQ